jgi:LytR cell envelope-related transcriptional attenuator
MMRGAISSGVLLNPVRLTKLVNATVASVQTDPGLSQRDILTLARRLKGLDPAKVTMVTVPVANADYRPGNGLGSTVLWDETAARRLFGDIRADQPVTVARPGAARVVATVPPNQIRVRVLNGAGMAGLGSRAAQALGAAGFAVVGPAANAASSGASQTVIRYDSRYTESVKTLQAALPGARLQKVTGLGRTFQVVVGSSFTTVSKVTITPRTTPSAAAPALKVQTAADASCS